jgi:hypothetical protein
MTRDMVNVIYHGCQSVADGKVTFADEAALGLFFLSQCAGS